MYSLTFFIVFIIGIFFSFRLEKNNNNKGRFFRFLILLTVLLFLSALFEKKIAIYHYTRVLALISVFSGFGFKIGFERIKNYWNNSIYQNAIIVTILLFSLFFSPALRMVNVMLTGYYFFEDKQRYDKKYQRDDNSVELRTDYLKVADMFLKNHKRDERITIISTGGNMINFFLKGKGISKFAHSSFYFSNIRIPKWEQDLLLEFKTTKWIAVQENDIHPYITGHNKSSWESLQKNKVMFDYIKSNFTVFDSSAIFVIFKRTD